MALLATFASSRMIEVPHAGAQQRASATLSVPLAAGLHDDADHTAPRALTRLHDSAPVRAAAWARPEVSWGRSKAATLQSFRTSACHWRGYRRAVRAFGRGPSTRAGHAGEEFAQVAEGHDSRGGKSWPTVFADSVGLVDGN